MRGRFGPKGPAALRWLPAVVVLAVVAGVLSMVGAAGAAADGGDAVAEPPLERRDGGVVQAWSHQERTDAAVAELRAVAEAARGGDAAALRRAEDRGVVEPGGYARMVADPGGDAAASAALAEVARDVGGTATELHGGWVRLRVAPEHAGEAAVRVAGLDGVRWLSPDRRLEPASAGSASVGPRLAATSTSSYSPNDPAFPSQWPLFDYGVLQAWDGTPDSTTRIGIVDTGIDTGVEVPPWRVVAEKNTVDGEPESLTGDVSGHGTAMAAIAAGEADNEVAGVGACPHCEIVNARVFDDTGQAYESDVVDGMMWAGFGESAEAITLSVVTTGALWMIDDAAQLLAQQGIATFAAAGNFGNDDPTFPGAFLSVTAVSGFTSDTEPHEDATYAGWWVELAGSWDNVAVDRDHYEILFEGSSGATALVAGIAGTLVDTDGGVYGADARAALRENADSHPDVYDGVVNAKAAFDALYGD